MHRAPNVMTISSRVWPSNFRAQNEMPPQNDCGPTERNSVGTKSWPQLTSNLLTLNQPNSWEGEKVYQNKKAPRETQTLRVGCSKAEPNIFAPPQTPFPGAQDGQNLISWRWSLPSPTDPVWWRSMHAISSYRGNRPTHKQTHRQDRLQYTTPLSLARSVIIRV